MPSDDFLALNPGYVSPRGKKPKTERAANVPTATLGTRAPNGWVADYDEAGRRGWQFATDAVHCWAWKPTGEMTQPVDYLGSYATAAGCYRLAVEECLKHG